jgi:flagellar protein FlaG
MVSEVSQVVASSTTTGTSGVGQSQSSKANETVQRTGNATPARATEASTFHDVGQQSAEVKREEVKVIVEELNELAQQIERQLQFSVDEGSGTTVIRVIDADTEEVIREIPPEEILTLRQRLSEVQGVLFKAEA